MTRARVAAVLTAVGVASGVAGGWTVSPTVGLYTACVLLLLLGVLIGRE